MANSGHRIERFTSLARFTHWTHVVSFFLLGLTGLALYYQPLNFIALFFGGHEIAKHLHRLAAIIFIAVPIVALVLRIGEFSKFLKEIFCWDADDKKFMPLFYKKFMGMPAQLPPQGRFNAGQKLNSIVIFSGSILMTISGLAMWMVDVFPLGFTRLMYPIHDLLGMVLMAAGIMHGYLAALHPDSKTSLEAMTKGSLPADFAKHHHYKWYKENVR